MNQKTGELITSARDIEGKSDPTIFSCLHNLWERTTGFDLVVITGGAINLIIVVCLVLFWVLHG